MTPTLLSASSAAYLATPVTASECSAAPVDGSPLSATASEESSDDHRDDVVPSDFAALLAAMMAASPLLPRIDSANATNSSGPAASVRDSVLVTSAGFATLAPLPSSDTGTSVATPIASEEDALSPANAPAPAPAAAPTTNGEASSTPSTPSKLSTANSSSALSTANSSSKLSTANSSSTAGSTPTDPLDAMGVPTDADRTVTQTPTTPSKGTDPSGADALTASVLAPSSMAGRGSSAPSFSLVALDRPPSLGRAQAVPLALVAEVPVPVAVSPPPARPAATIGPQVGIGSQELSPAETAPLPEEGDAALRLAAVPAGPPTVALSAVLSSLVVPGSGEDEVLDPTSAGDGGSAMPIETDASAPVAPTAVRRIGDWAENGVVRTAATAPPQSADIAVAARGSREEPSASSDEDTALSSAGVSAGPGHASLADRAGSVETTLPVVEGVRPGDAPQHIVRAAQRAQAADGTQHMRLEMHPGDLGAVAVEVTIEGGAVHVTMVAERGETKDLLRSSIGELRSSLVAAGFSAGRVDIQSGLSDGRFGQAADRQDAWSQSFDRPDSRREHSAWFAGMFDQSSGRGDQARSPRPYSEADDRGGSVSALRRVRGSDRILPDPATTPYGLRRDRVDLQL